MTLLQFHRLKDFIQRIAIAYLIYFGIFTLVAGYVSFREEIELGNIDKTRYILL